MNTLSDYCTCGSIAIVQGFGTETGPDHIEYAVVYFDCGHFIKS